MENRRRTMDCRIESEGSPNTDSDNFCHHISRTTLQGCRGNNPLRTESGRRIREEKRRLANVFTKRLKEIMLFFGIATCETEKLVFSYGKIRKIALIS